MFGLFPLDFRKILLIIFIFALPLISINIQRNPGEAPWYLRPVTLVVEYVQLGYSKLVFVVRDTTKEYVNLIDIKKNNRLLHEKVQELETQLAIHNELRAENERLTALLDFKSREPMDLRAARVIGFDLNGQYATVRIDHGSKNGILPGQAVITPKGVVGSILSSEASIAHVLVLTDRYSVVDAMVQRSRARGIVEGKTQTTAQLKYLQRTDDVQSGDLVVTSGLDSTLPQGFPIGKIIAVEKKPFGITQLVELEPMIDASQLEEVFVVLKVHNQEPTKNVSMNSGPQ